MISYRSLSLAAAAASLAVAALAAAKGPPVSHAWLYFGHDPARTNVVAGPTGVTRASLRHLRRVVVHLPGTVDSSPAYLPHLPIHGRTHDTLFVTTSYGRTVALDAQSGRTLWRYAPAAVKRWERTGEITEASPVADPARGVLYTASPDGLIHRLSLADGDEDRGGAWPVSTTLMPGHEKLSSSLGVSGRLLVATTSSFLDEPPYAGHLVTIDLDTGATAGVFDTDCSDRRALPTAATCPSGGSIWGRAGAILEPGSGRLLLATANGPWNGRDEWGQSVVELSPDGTQVLGSWTPRDHARLTAADRDIGSMSPALLTYRGRSLVLQGAKDGVLRLIDLAVMRTPGRLGGELDRVHGADANGFYNQAAVLQRRGTSIAFVANHGATVAYVVRGPRPHLAKLWQTTDSGTSPVLAGGLLYVFDPDHRRLDVREPLTGRLLAALPAAHGHWNSPIVADGRIVLPEGGANEQRTTGTLVIWSARR